MENFQVVAVRPFASSTVAVVGVGTRVHVFTSCPFKIRESNDVFQRWQSAVGCISQSFIDTVEQSGKLIYWSWHVTYPVSASLRKGLAARAKLVKVAKMMDFIVKL